ncbi:MAG TPA: hypothetical protein VFG30_33725 [Polyangiales bacterium]|nr:hypothetical protein [Polyangiales bacterium]
MPITQRARLPGTYAACEQLSSLSKTISISFAPTCCAVMAGQCPRDLRSLPGPGAPPSARAVERLTDIDDADGALKTTREAVDILRKLVERGPEAFLPDLAIGLHNLGLILSGAGNQEGALRAL